MEIVQRGRVLCLSVGFVLLLAGPAAALGGFEVEGYVVARDVVTERAAQVQVDGRVLEATNDLTDDLGIDWDIHIGASPTGPAVLLEANLGEGAPTVELQGHVALTFETRVVPQAAVAPDGSALPEIVPVGITFELSPEVELDGSISLGTTLAASARVVTDATLGLPELSVATAVSLFGVECSTPLARLEPDCGGTTTVYGSGAQAGVVSLVTVETFLTGFFAGPGRARLRAYADPVLMVDGEATFGAGFRYADFFDVEVSPDVTMSVPEPRALLAVAWAGVAVGLLGSRVAAARARTRSRR